MKPSHFARTFPHRSMFHKWEHEQVALNIVKILKRTGDKWRRLSLDEYIDARRYDNASNHDLNLERPLFIDIQDIIISEYGARQFSVAWDEICKIAENL